MKKPDITDKYRICTRPDFINRVTNYQLKRFVIRNAVFDKERDTIDIRRYNDCIYVDIKYREGKKSTFFFYNFSASLGNSADDLEWIRYLYKRFGEEYKRAYFKVQEKIFE